MTLFPMGYNDALIWAVSFLKEDGIELAPSLELASHILLPVPSFDDSGNIRGGGSIRDLPENAVIIGGKLDLPELQGRSTMDLLADEVYVAKNAMITAHCALRYALERLPVTLEGCPVLVIGFGRIGKCMAKLLAGLGAQVTVAARKGADRALAQALGYRAVPTEQLDERGYRVIYNTVPVMVLPQGAPGIKIDLASRPGIGGRDVIWARGLPGKDAPESSGKLIAETVLRLVR